MTTDYTKRLEEKNALEQQLKAAKKAMKKDALSEIKSIIKSIDLTYEDLLPILPAPAIGRHQAKTAKYNNPLTGETWTGRGKAPSWLDGKEKAQFLIPSGER